MRILWLAPEPPIPPLSGGRERACQMINYLATGHKVHLATFATLEDRPGLEALAANLTGLRSIQYGNRGAMRRAARQIVRHHRPDAVHVQGIPMWKYIPRGFGGKRTLDLHDAPGGPLPTRTHRADANIVVSKNDRATVLGYGCPAPVAVLPNGVDLNYWSQVTGDPNPKTILFPAALNWPVNMLAVQTLAYKVLPGLRQHIPDVRLIIAGRQPPPDLLAFPERLPEITLIPDPPDMRPLFAQAAVIVVPIAQATGTRLKILQALAAGRPVVSTPTGAMGLELEAGKHLLIAPLVEPFVEAVVGVLTDSCWRAELVQAGREAVTHHDWKHHLPILDEVYPR